MPLRTWTPILLWHLCTRELLLSDFLVEWLYPRKLDGMLHVRTDDVRQYLEEQPEYGDRVDRLTDMLLWLLPKYRREHRSYLTVAVGCTGGTHRSVYMAEELGSLLRKRGFQPMVKHRDLGK